MNTSKSALLPAFLALGFAHPLFAADQAPKADIWGVTPSPALSEVSLTTKFGYDSNVFGADNFRAGKEDIADKESFIFSISPKLTVNLVKAWDIPKDSAVQSFSIGYAGDYNFFGSESSENNYRHSLPVSLKAKQGAWSFALDNTLLYIDGKKDALYYGNNSAYGSAFTRERREQVQNRLSTSFRYDVSSEVFVRAAGNSLTFDLKTTQVNATGYQNWVDRSDIGGGLDLGYKASKDLAFTVGWRAGQQFHDRYTWGGKHSTSSFNRVLVGFEGKLAPWLTGSLTAGPDFRRYSDSANLGINGTNHTWLYGDANLTASASDADKIIFVSKVWHWVSSTGNTSYQDASYALTWKHTFDKNLSGSIGVKLGASKYDAPATRNDQFWTIPVGLSYSFSKEIVLSADYQYAKASNRLSDVSFPGREFDQNVFTVTLKLAL